MWWWLLLRPTAARAVGFFPSIFAATEAVGVWGFILGSGVIGASQVWKVYRIGVRGLCASREKGTACGVEAGACAGALCYLVGTILFLVLPGGSGSGSAGSAAYTAVLALWVCGGVAFSLGGAFLAYRHFVMRVS